MLNDVKSSIATCAGAKSKVAAAYVTNGSRPDAERVHGHETD
jgi:hypothetical protein